MSDDALVVSGGGSYAVATDDQLDRVQRLEAFVDTARTIIDQLVTVNGLLGESELRAAGAPAGALDAERELELSVTLLTQAAAQAERVAKLIRAAMLTYGRTEHERVAAGNALMAEVGAMLGVVFGPDVFIAATIAVVAMGAISPGVESTGESSGAQKYLRDHPGLYSDPRFVGAVRAIVDAMDDTMLSAGYLPPQVIDKLKELGLSGPELAAALLVAAGAPFGKLKDSKVALTKTTTHTGAGAAPTGWQDRIARIPDTAHNGGYQIRIDRYVDANGKPSFEVYLSGTQTFSTSKTDTPFDMTSNMKGIAGQPNASLASVEKAMKAAGIRPGDPVNITGHSQGGLIAHEVAATGHWNVKVAFEAGPPASQTPLPGDTTEVVLAHNEDVVTSLGGTRTDDKAIVVHATAFPDGTVPTGESTPPAHNTHRYEHTAHELDLASSSMINDAKEKMNSSEKGASNIVTTTYYKAERVWSK